MSPLQFYRSLAAQLPDAPSWCLALVLHTQGSTPRKRGAMMALGADVGGIRIAVGSIGGGLAEARVIAAAQLLLTSSLDRSEINIELAGDTSAGSPERFSGICGGSMRIVLLRPERTPLQAHAAAVIDALSAGQDVQLSSENLALNSPQQISADSLLLRAHPRCFIGGGGHCGVALASVLSQIGFAVSMVDDRAQIVGCEPPADAERFGDWQAALANLSGEKPMAVLLSRNFQHDLLALDAIAATGAEFSYIGMMGSARRIRLVLAERPALSPLVSSVLRAPVGMQIGAETPMEIAISIAAELIQIQAKRTLDMD